MMADEKCGRRNGHELGRDKQQKTNPGVANISSTDGEISWVALPGCAQHDA